MMSHRMKALGHMTFQFCPKSNRCCHDHDIVNWNTAPWIGEAIEALQPMKLLHGILPPSKTAREGKGRRGGGLAPCHLNISDK